MGFSDKLRATRRAWAKEATWYLTYCAVAFAFGDLLFGIDTGSFGSIQALPSFLTKFAPANANGVHAFDTRTKSIMNSLVWPGKLIGTIVFDPLVNKFGYKLCMYFVAVLQIVALIVELTAKDWQTFSGGRIIAYFGVGIVENLVPSYLSEISPGSLRGFFAGIMNQVVACGNLWGSGMGRAYANEPANKGWQIAVAVQFIPCLMMIIMVPFCPESPRWLVLKGKKDAAIKALDRLRPHDDVVNGLTTAEADALEAAVIEGNAQQQGSWLDLFRGNYFRRAMIGAWIFIYNQSTGNQFINLYGPTFFKSVGLGAMAFTYNTLILGLAIFAGIIGICLVDIVGRRTLCIVGISTATIFNAVSGGVGSMKPLGDAQIHTIVASLCLVACGNKISVNPLCYVIAAEVGGVRMRKKILAWSTAWDVVAAFVMSYSIPYLIGTPGANLGAKTGFFFMGVCISALIFIVFFLPDLTGRSLEEVDELFDRNLWAWQFASAETHGIGHTIAQLEQGRGDKAAARPEQVMEEGHADDKRDITEIH